MQILLCRTANVPNVVTLDPGTSDVYSTVAEHFGYILFILILTNFMH